MVTFLVYLPKLRKLEHIKLVQCCSQKFLGAATDEAKKLLFQNFKKRPFVTNLQSFGRVFGVPSQYKKVRAYQAGSMFITKVSRFNNWWGKKKFFFNFKTSKKSILFSSYSFLVTFLVYLPNVRKLEHIKLVQCCSQKLLGAATDEAKNFCFKTSKIAFPNQFTNFWSSFWYSFPI